MPLPVLEKHSFTLVKPAATQEVDIPVPDLSRIQGPQGTKMHEKLLPISARGGKLGWQVLLIISQYAH